MFEALLAAAGGATPKEPDWENFVSTQITAAVEFGGASVENVDSYYGKVATCQYREGKYIVFYGIDEDTTDNLFWRTYTIDADTDLPTFSSETDASLGLRENHGLQAEYIEDDKVLIGIQHAKFRIVTFVGDTPTFQAEFEVAGAKTSGFATIQQHMTVMDTDTAIAIYINSGYYYELNALDISGTTITSRDTINAGLATYARRCGIVKKDAGEFCYLQEAFYSEASEQYYVAGGTWNGSALAVSPPTRFGLQGSAAGSCAVVRHWTGDKYLIGRLTKDSNSFHRELEFVIVTSNGTDTPTYGNEVEPVVGGSASGPNIHLGMWVVNGDYAIAIVHDNNTKLEFVLMSLSGIVVTVESEGDLVTTDIYNSAQYNFQLVENGAQIAAMVVGNNSGEVLKMRIIDGSVQ